MPSAAVIPSRKQSKMMITGEAARVRAGGAGSGDSERGSGTDEGARLGSTLT